MKWIGLTGGIATGKSTVTKVLRELNLPVVDADALAREAVRPGSKALQAIVREFGSEVLAHDKSLDRKRLGEIVFADSNKRVRLEQIVHPEVRVLQQNERKRLEEQGVSLAFYDVPLLFEAHMESLFDGIVVVACSPEEQLRRLTLRDGLSAEKARQRIQNQIPIQTKIAGADHVIDNSAGISELRSKVESLVKKLLAT